MGKAKRGQTSARARSDDAVESFDAGGVSFVRDGKNIYTRNYRTPDQHEAFLAAVRGEMLPRLREERQRLRHRLDEVLREADPVDLLAQAGFLYLPIDPDTFKEWESDRNPAHIEYIAMQVLPESMGAPPRATDPRDAASLTGEAIELARQLFDVEAQLLTFGQADNAASMHEQTQQYRARTQLQSLAVRGSGYTEHLRAILLGTLGQLNTECQRFLGFTASQALDISTAMVEVVADRMEPRIEEALAAQQEMLRHLPRQRRKGVPGPVPEWIVAMKPTEAKQWIGVITRMWAYAAARDLATVTPENVAEASGIPEANVEAFLNAFACPPEAYDERHHRFPVGAHPLTESPVLRVAGGYMLPVPSSIVEALRPRMEDLLQHADAAVWNRYLTVRGAFVEGEAVRRLSAALPGASGSVGLEWKSASDQSDLDGLVTVDDVTLRIQAKAGRVHASTRRGAPERMKRNLAELIKEAARQHAALDVAIAEEGTAAIGLGKHRSRLEDAPFQIEVIVCLDDVTVWSTHTHELQDIDVLPRDRPIPWILSLADLMAVTDLLQGSQLLHYVTRRLRLEAFGKIAAHDELDWVGYYIDRGLYFEGMFDGPGAPDAYQLLSFTEPIDAWYFTREGVRATPAPKPEQTIPPQLASLIQRLEQERPTHWTVAAMAFLMGDDEARHLWDERIVHAMGRRFTHGWSNASQGFLPAAGVTYLMDYRPPREQFEAKLAEYVEEKMAQGDAANWIAIGDSGEGSLRVVVQSAEPRGIAGVFLSGQRGVSPE